MPRIYKPVGPSANKAETPIKEVKKPEEAPKKQETKQESK